MGCKDLYTRRYCVSVDSGRWMMLIMTLSAGEVRVFVGQELWYRAGLPDL